ncbi:MAG: competence/damage-inducible protein A [Bacteroidales bacterium]|nr:competence/damage-inducible protein A [Bacteroidales bacterium]
MTNAKIIIIGDEILIGQVKDTNSGFLANFLDKLGIKVEKVSTIGDNKNDILTEIDNGIKNYSITILSGGLGPTKDDITKKTIAEYFNSKLIENKEVLEHVKQIQKLKNITPNALNLSQAKVPECCQIIKNENGTAPGMWIEQNKNILISLPGVPFELEYISKNELEEKIKNYFKLKYNIHQNIQTQGIAESELATKLSEWENKLPQNIKLAYLPSAKSVTLRLSMYQEDKEKAEIEINQQIEKIKKIIPNNIYTTTNLKKEEILLNLLREKNKTFCTAESCTGGNISATLTRIPGCSDVFKGGAVVYCNEAKHNILGVKNETLEKYTAVSEETVKEMAEGALKLYNCDYAASVSGCAGPGGGTKEIPVGTICFGLARKGKSTITKKCFYYLDRQTNIDYSTNEVINMMLNELT